MAERGKGTAPGLPWALLLAFCLHCAKWTIEPMGLCSLRSRPIVRRVRRMVHLAHACALSDRLGSERRSHAQHAAKYSSFSGVRLETLRQRVLLNVGGYAWTGVLGERDRNKRPHGAQKSGLRDLRRTLQFDSVCATTPSERAASEARWPDSTRPTPSWLRSRV